MRGESVFCEKRKEDEKEKRACGTKREKGRSPMFRRNGLG